MTEYCCVMHDQDLTDDHSLGTVNDHLAKLVGAGWQLANACVVPRDDHTISHIWFWSRAALHSEEPGD